jgi:ADP-ribose pyrophosphatase
VTRQLYKGRIVDLRLEHVTLPNGTTAALEVVHHPGAAAVAAVDDGGNVVLIRQYRHAAGGFIWELPAGVLAAPEESPEACARRELEEEVGLRAGAVRHLGTILTTPGFTDERIHLFLARDLGAGRTAHEADEVIAEVRWVALHEALAMVRRGEIVDGKTIAGLYLAGAALGVGP